MMIKRALASGEDAGAQLITPGRPGVKTAGMLPVVEEFVERLRPDPRYMYTLVNAMGNSQFYGDNSNTDWYGYNEHIDFDGLLHAPENCAGHGDFAGWQTDPVVQARVAKQWPFGYPSFYGASVFAHHKNQDAASLGFGDVALSTYNEAMHRVELVMRVDVELAAKRGHTAILDRIKRGERTDVSMGAKVPFDNCSICTDWGTFKKAWKTYDSKRHSSPGTAILAYHRTVSPIRGLAVTKTDYCEHMLNQRGKILPDGRKVYVYNDFPRFFDISFVWIGADRTARVMWFLGHSQATHSRARPSSLSELMKGASMGTVKTASVEKKSTLKRAEIEKEIPGGIARKIELCSNSEVDLPFGVLADFSKRFGAKTLLSTLGGLGVAVKPQEFHIVISIGSPLQEPLAKKAHEEGVTFRSSLPGCNDSATVDASLFSMKLAAELLPFLEARSSFAPHLHYRMGTMAKVATAPVRQCLDTVFVRDVAAAYNGYRGSLLKESAALFSNYHSVVPMAVGDMVKSASTADLLLSGNTVVHWVSAHLDKVGGAEEELRRAMKYVMTDLSHQKLSALGAEVCIRMDSNTGFLDAFKKTVTTVL